MRATHAPAAIVVMGVSGTGKSTVGAALATRLGYAFIEGDSLHSTDSIAHMAAGRALTDEERLPWLHAVGERLAEEIAEHGGAVAACSALTRAYRDILRGHVHDVYFVELTGDEGVIEGRVVARHDGFMPASMLASQYATLQELGADEWGARVDVAAPPTEVVDRILATLPT